MKKSQVRLADKTNAARKPLRSDLTKRLLGYSATVAACAAAAPDSEATIVYRDFGGVVIDAASLPVPGQGDPSRKVIMGFDIDDDGAEDINFSHYTSFVFRTASGPTVAYIAGLGQPDAPFVDRVAANGTFYPFGGTGPGAAHAYPLRYNPGDTVSPANAGFTVNQFGPGFGVLARSNGAFFGNSNWYLDGNGNEFVEGFIGIRFKSQSTETLLGNNFEPRNVYGWVRIRVQNDSSGSPSPFAITVLDAAYQSDGTAITIPEPNSLGLLALGALGLLGTRRRVRRADSSRESQAEA